MVVGLFFSSCYSYKKLDIRSDQLTIGDHYQLTTLKTDKWKGKVVQLNDSVITMQISSQVKVNLPVSQVYDVRKRDFSVGKTIGLSVTAIGASIGIVALVQSIDVVTFSGDVTAETKQ